VIERTDEMERVMYAALAAQEPGRHHAALRKGLAAVLAIVERDLTAVVPIAERAGYEKAIAILLGVYVRTGSQAAKWAAEYLTVDPDKEGPAAAS
jgi:hypothetical protein